MGGSVALTIRFSPEKQYRGSCWTNVLPEGLWAAPFYIDLDTSRKHTEQWLENLLEHRRRDPELEEMWGGHDTLAPLGYGLVIIDYVTSTLISAQGYSSPDWMIRFDDPDKLEKWDALEKAGLLGESPSFWRRPPEARNIKMPFADVRCTDVDKIDTAMQQWCEENFGLSDAERAVWKEFMEAMAE